MKKIIFFLFPFILASCANTILRTSYMLSEAGPFLISNSETNPFRFEKNKNIIQLKYTLLIKNNSSKEEGLTLEGSQIVLNSKASILNCKVNSQDKINVPSQKIVKAICDVSIDPIDYPEVLNKDAIFGIIFLVNYQYKILANYKTVIEDFE